MNINVQSVQFTADEKLIGFIEKKINKLEQFYDRIVNVDVFLTLENQSTKAKDKTVRINCNVPGTKLFAEETCKVFEEGVDTAVGSLKRQLKKHKEKLRS